jgi:hypothetical protein
MGAVAALIIAAGFTLPAAIPYLDLSRRNALVRPEVAFEGHSARLFDFLAPFDRSLVYGTINEELAPVVGERTLFPGAITFFLVIMSGFLWWKTRAERRAAASDGSREPDFAWGLWILIGAVTIVFCFGPEARVGDGGTSIPLPYALFQKLAPFADQMRVPARWMLPALLPASLLAAATMHAITRGDPRAARFLTVLIVGGLVMESVGRPIATVEIATSPRAVDVWLAERTYPSPALELPLRPADDNTPMLDATRHGQPIVNGTNGYFPPDYRAWMRAASELPSAEAWRTLRQYQHDPAIAIRYIIFDLGASADASGEWNEERVEETIARIGEAFAARRDFGEIVVLELRRGEAR